jgi:hypothetical protein
MSKMGLHDPFGHLKHKLWPKDGPGVKLAVWFLTTKSQESTRFPCVQVACNMMLKSSRQGLQLCFRPHLNWMFECKVMGPQSRGNPKTKCHLDVGLMERHKVYYKGKVVASPKSRPWWILWVQACPWLVLTPKMFQLCTNQLVIWFCANPCEWLNACHSS